MQCRRKISPNAFNSLIFLGQGRLYPLILITNLDIDNRAKDITEQSWGCDDPGEKCEERGIDNCCDRDKFHRHRRPCRIRDQIHTTEEDIGARGSQQDRIGDKRSKILKLIFESSINHLVHKRRNVSVSTRMTQARKILPLFLSNLLCLLLTLPPHSLHGRRLIDTQKKKKPNTRRTP